MTNNNDVLVSVLLHTYNQAPYIEQAILSVVNQKTDFKYEIIVIDDFSTDGTREIIESVASQYPDLIIPLLHKFNYFSNGDFSFREEIEMMKGTYVAFLDGDDYWTDENKLQKQVDLFKKYPDFSMITHRVRCITYDDKIRENPAQEIRFHSIDPGIVPIDLFAKTYFTDGTLVFQTSSFLLKREVVEKYLEEYDLYGSLVGMGFDRRIFYALFHFGSIYYMDEYMSNYRSGGTDIYFSISSDLYLTDKTKTYNKNRTRSIMVFDKHTNYRFHKYINIYIEQEIKQYFHENDMDFVKEMHAAGYKLSIGRILAGKIYPINNIKAKIYWVITSLKMRMK